MFCGTGFVKGYESKRIKFLELEILQKIHKISLWKINA